MKHKGTIRRLPAKDRQQHDKSCATVVGICSLIILIGLLSGCRASASNEADAATNTKPQNPLEIKVDGELLHQLKIGEPTFSEVAGKLQVAGRIDADATRLARIGSPVAGRITDLLVTEGEHVK